MFIGDFFFLVSSIMNGFALNYDMLFLGRIFRGYDVGYFNEV